MYGVVSLRPSPTDGAPVTAVTLNDEQGSVSVVLLLYDNITHLPTLDDSLTIDEDVRKEKAIWRMIVFLHVFIRISLKFNAFGFQIKLGVNCSLPTKWLASHSMRRAKVGNFANTDFHLILFIYIYIFFFGGGG